jgi:hypothetical protein
MQKRCGDGRMHGSRPGHVAKLPTISTHHKQEASGTEATQMANHSDALAPIRPDELYPGELFEQMTGLGRSAIREARRKGLKVLYVHARLFIRGSDWIAYCDEHGKETKDA